MNRNRRHDMDSNARINRLHRVMLSWLLIVGLLLGTALPAGASTGDSGSKRTLERRISLSDRIRAKFPDEMDPGRAEALQAPQAKNNAASLKQAKQMMNQKLMASNRLYQEIGDLKKKTGKQVEAARNRIRQMLKKSDNLSGEQIVALKDVVSQLKQYRDNVGVQERKVMEILKRLHDLRAKDQFADSISVLDELVAAQKKMIEILKSSGTAVVRIEAILKS